MRRWLVLAVGAIAVLAVGALLSPPTTAQEPDEPSVSVDARSGRFGEPLGVRGTGWLPNSTAFVELCGNEARNGTPDCDQENARLVGVSSSGSFTVPILVGQPPSPCPCVIQVSNQGSPVVATAPVEIPEAAFADLDEQAVDPSPSRQLALSGWIEGTGPWTAWLGASPRRTVVITAENVGDVATDDSVVSLALGGGDDPTGFLESVEVGRLAPGESERFEIPIELGALAFGSYTVTGEIAALDEPATFSAQTSSYPWALILIPLAAVVQFVLLRVRNRVRNRLHPMPAPEEELTSALVPAVAGALPAATTGLAAEPHNEHADSGKVTAEDEVTEQKRAEEEEEPSERVLVGTMAGGATAGSTVRGDESTTDDPTPPANVLAGSAVGHDEVPDATTAADQPVTDTGSLVESELENTLVETLAAEIGRAIEHLGDQSPTRAEVERLAEQVTSEVSTSMAGQVDLSPVQLGDLSRELSRELTDSLAGRRPNGEGQRPCNEVAAEQREAASSTGNRGWPG